MFHIGTQLFELSHSHSHEHKTHQQLFYVLLCRRGSLLREFNTQNVRMSV